MFLGTLISCISIPTNEICKVMSFSGTSIKNLPSISLITPLLEPFSKIVAPGNVCPSAPITRPLIVRLSVALRCVEYVVAVSFAAHTIGDAAESSIPEIKQRAKTFRLSFIKQKN